MLLGNYSPWMGGPVLTLTQMFLLFHLKDKRKKLKKKRGKKKTTKEIDFPKITLS